MMRMMIKLLDKIEINKFISQSHIHTYTQHTQTHIMSVHTHTITATTEKHIMVSSRIVRKESNRLPSNQQHDKHTTSSSILLSIKKKINKILLHFCDLCDFLFFCIDFCFFFYLQFSSFFSSFQPSLFFIQFNPILILFLFIKSINTQKR